MGQLLDTLGRVSESIIGAMRSTLIQQHNAVQGYNRRRTAKAPDEKSAYDQGFCENPFSGRPQ